MGFAYIHGTVRAETTTHLTLLARLTAGRDPDAWDEFCRRYGELVRGFAHRQGLQAADCDDILQDVLIRLVRTMPRFTYDPAKGKFRSYLKTVVLRAVYERFSQKKGVKPVENIESAANSAAGDAQIEQVWETEWRRYHLRQAMRTIEVEFSAKDVAAFQAYAVDGRDVQTTCDLLGISADQVYQAKSRILRRLSALIEQQVEDEG